MLDIVSLLLGRFTQATRMLRLTTSLGPDVLLAECVRGEEGISEGYTFTISALSTDAGISLRALIGQPALLELMTVNHGELRPFHGHLTAVEITGANGGMARYKLTLQPWFAFLARGRDSRVFQDKTVFDILDAVFASYQGLGKLAPAWRFDIAERDAYPLRSLTTQYQESDFAFAERLMSEEGLFYFFKHSAAGHEMVIADHNGAFKPNRQPAVRYTQPGAVMKEDSMDRWRTEYKLRTNAVEMSSWDYRTRDTRAVGATGIQADNAGLVSRDAPGVYAYADRKQGQRIADNQVMALDAQREVFIGAGTVRTLAPGTTFTLLGHAVDDAGSFAVTRTVHLMHNNLGADLQSELHRIVGESALGAAMLAEQSQGLHARAGKMGERPLYRNRIDAIRAELPYRASRTDGHGKLLHPQPTIRGQQTAIVVGPAGAAIHTDRDHRIKVQFHWQRGTDSHSRLAHPAPESHSGAPADDSAGTWVRIATPLAPFAGANWGSNAVPRVGQEVLVDFLEGNIDRPVVIGALYNGAGTGNAQNNDVAHGAGVATGNAPTWFPGDAGAHAHPAVLSGMKSQVMQASQAGAGAYSQLVFDDSPGQSRVGLQWRATAHKDASELNMGHLRHQTDNQRLRPLGYGAELKTAQGVALRAGQGMLLSSDERTGADSAQLDSREAQAQITSSQELQQAMAETARKHNAGLTNEPAPADLPAIAQMARSAAVIAAVDSGATGTSGKVAAGGLGEATAYGAPHMQLSSPSGIIATTPASAIFSVGKTSSLVAGADINFAAQANSLHTVAAGISLFTYGKATNGAKPNTETGIRLHAASGKVSVQSQADETRLTADKSITVASTTRTINVAAKEHVLLTAQGAYIRLEGGNIMLHGPGKIEFKASMKELAGPQKASPTLPRLPQAGDIHNFIELNYRWDDKQPMVGAPYKLLFDDGTSIEGKLDANGFARVENVPASGARVTYGEDEREAQPRKKMPPNALLGATAASDEEAQAILTAYLEQEDAYYEENFFPDELEEMSMEAAGTGEVILDYDFHYGDYRYTSEDTPANLDAEADYRDSHAPNDDDVDDDEE